MKKSFIFLFICVSSLSIKGQDTLSDFKFKIGLKYIPEHSSFHVLTDTTSYLVHNIGVPFIIRFGKSKSSIETGLYLINKKEVYLTNATYIYYGYHFEFLEQNRLNLMFIRIPVNYRLETRIIYFSSGFCIDNLIKITSASANSKIDIDEDSFGSRLKIGFNINIGIEKNLNNNLSFFIESRFSSDIPDSYFSPEIIYANGDPLQNFGFGIGFNYKINSKKN